MIWEKIVRILESEKYFKEVKEFDKIKERKKISKILGGKVRVKKKFK